MRKQQKQKVMAIVALCISVLGLTLGFAAFSNTLTISSSATVTPDSSDFKLKLYGLSQTYETENIDFDDIESIALLDSPTTLAPIIETINMSYPATGDIAIIDNENLTIKGLKANFTGPDHSIEYPFLIKNEGEYDAYFNLAKYQDPTHTCEAGEETTLSLMEKACEKMKFSLDVGYIDETTSKIEWNISNLVDATGNVKLSKGEYFVAKIVLSYKYSTDRVDGPMSVKWEDLKLEFTSNAQ